MKPFCYRKEISLKLLFAAIAITTLILPIILVQAYAQEGRIERSLTLKVTNTKTDTVQMRVWNLTAYTFEQNIPIDVPQFQVKKIKKIYGTDTFSFTLQNKVFEGEWLHFKVEVIGTPVVGKGLRVQFI